MKVYNCGEIEINVGIDFNCVNEVGILDNGDGIMLPYENGEFLFAIRSFIDDVVFRMRPKWKVPDYQKSKCYFYIIGDRINLLVEALPKRFSAEDRKMMLCSANTATREDGYSDYYELLDIFDAIDNILNSVSPIGEMCYYPIKVDEAEMDLLFSLCV